MEPRGAVVFKVSAASGAGRIQLRFDFLERRRIDSPRVEGESGLTERVARAVGSRHQRGKVRHDVVSMWRQHGFRVTKPLTTPTRFATMKWCRPRVTARRRSPTAPRKHVGAELRIVRNREEIWQNGPGMNLPEPGVGIFGAARTPRRSCKLRSASAWGGLAGAFGGAAYIAKNRCNGAIEYTRTASAAWQSPLREYPRFLHSQ